MTRFEEQFAASTLPEIPSWFVTLSDHTTEVTVQVQAWSKMEAQRVALWWQPSWHVLQVEKA